MLISVATANYYTLPFERTLEIIALSGMRHIELDLFWERKHWAMAQHLRGYAPRDVVRLVKAAGLTVASIHDGGGVIEEPADVRGFINPRLAETLDALGYAPGCLVFHTPHIEGRQDGAWWASFVPRAIAALEAWRGAGSLLTIENMPFFDGYTVPLSTPEELLAFARQADLGVTLDTTHYAQIGEDIVRAAWVLRGRVNTIHLSDFVDGASHVFPGYGALNFAAFFNALDVSTLHSVTLECAPGRPGEDPREMSTAALAKRLQEVKHQVEGWVE